MSYITRQQQAVLSCLSQRREEPLTVNDLAEALRQKMPEIAPDFGCFTRLETFDKNMEVYR